MKTILVCNQKGGVGKTLIADEIAFNLESDGSKTDSVLVRYNQVRTQYQREMED